MGREEFIGKLEMVYVGDRNAFDDIVCVYDSVLSANEKAAKYIKEHQDMAEWIHIPSWDLLNILQNGSETNDKN